MRKVNFPYFDCISSLIAPSKLFQTFIYILLDSQRIVKHYGAGARKMETDGLASGNGNVKLNKFQNNLTVTWFEIR